MPARTFGEPIADQLGLVARGVVHDNVDVEISRHILFDLVEELAELARAMARHAFCDDLADLDVERCEERRGAVALVVMRASLDLAGAHRQQGLRAVKSLKVSTRCGCRPKAPQRRCTRVTETPEALAIDRRLQWVASSGIVSSV